MREDLSPELSEAYRRAGFTSDRVTSDWALISIATSLERIATRLEEITDDDLGRHLRTMGVAP